MEDTRTTLSELSLFSGYGGFSLGLRLAGLNVRTVGYVEIEPYCQKLLWQRMKDGYLDYAPIIRDIRAADFRPMAGRVDIITAGFPCQPHSFAGKRQGEADERNLWPDTLRAVSEVGPRWVLLENVPGILANGYAGTVVGQLAEIGYNCEWGVVSAADVGAPHLRKRWWCLAHASDDGCRSWGWPAQQERQHHPLERSEQPRPNGENGAVADSECAQWREDNLARREGGGQLLSPWQEGSIRFGASGEDVADSEGKPGALWTTTGQRQGRPAGGTGAPSTRLTDAGWWAIEPPVGRVANGVTHRVDRLKALGNGIVPSVVAEFLRRLW